jgi:hypothetical protein
MKIYALYDIRDPDVVVYVGSTKRRLSTRLKGHLDHPSPNIAEWIKAIGRKNVGICQLEKCEISERAEREIWHMSLYDDLLNMRMPSAHSSDNKRRHKRYGRRRRGRLM